MGFESFKAPKLKAEVPGKEEGNTAETLSKTSVADNTLDNVEEVLKEAPDVRKGTRASRLVQGVLLAAVALGALALDTDSAKAQTQSGNFDSGPTWSATPSDPSNPGMFVIPRSSQPDVQVNIDLNKKKRPYGGIHQKAGGQWGDNNLNQRQGEPSSKRLHQRMQGLRSLVR